MAEVTIKLDSPISIVDKGTPSTTNLPKGSIALEKDKNNNLKIYGNVGNEVVDIERVDALGNGDASASFVAGRNLKVNGWEFYWKDVWEESEPSAIKHIESAGVNAAINEIKGTGADVSAFTFPTTKDEFIAYLKTITFDFSNQPNQVSGYGSVTYGIMNKNAGTTTIVEGMRNAVPNKIHRSHIEGQYMTFPDVEYALDCHVEGQDCNIVGYASICHLEGNSNATVHSMNPNASFWEEALGCHVEGGNNVVGGKNSHAEGQYNAALGTASHCEGKGFYSDYITDWKQRTYRDNDYIVSKWKETPLGKKEGETKIHYKFSAAIAPFSHIEGMGNITEECGAKFSGLDTGVETVFINGSNHAEGVGNYNGGAASHVEGIRNEINKDAYASHAEGIKNTTKNRAEHASGQYNKSNKATDTFGDTGNTLFSIGCGTSDADRKNAFEVMQDGTCKYLDVATGEQIDVGVAKELSKPFDLTIGSTTKKVDGKSAVSFDAVELGIQDKSNTYIIDVSSGTPEIILNVNEEVDSTDEYLDRFKHVAVSSELGFDGIFNLNCTLHLIYGDDDSNALLDLTGVGRLADRIVKIFLEYKTVYNSSSNTYKLLDQPERYSIKQFENYELVLSDYTTIDTTNSILPTTKAGWIALRNEPDLPIILKLSIGTYKCVGVTETSGVYHFEFILNNQDAQSQFGVYKLIVDTSQDTITQTVEYIDRMPKQQTATSTVNAFNGSLIQGLTTASTEADIRKAFTEVNTKTVLFPTPGSIISKLDGGNKGIVVSLSEPDATTLGRSIVVYYGDGTYTIVVKNDFTKVLVPWRKDSSLRDLYISAGAKYNEATGFYELNGLTDITEEEMRTIYKESKSWAPSGWMLMASSKMRTNLPITGGDYTGGIGSIFEHCQNIEVINMRGSFGTSQCVVYKNYQIGEMLVRSFRDCPKLKKIMGILNIETQTSAEDRMFELDIALESVMLKGWQGWEFSFKSCPNISKESILYLINNSSLTKSAIGSAPITLHPTAYARLKDDADIVAALEAKGGIVTLVSA